MYCTICLAVCKRIGAADPCGMSGVWTNTLNSTMEVCCQDGQLYGQYMNGVGDAEDFYELSGRYTMIGGDCSFGWSIAYHNKVHGNSNSTASWAGVHFAEDDNIYTHWLLSRHTRKQDYWMSFMINHDDFKRRC